MSKTHWFKSILGAAVIALILGLIFFTNLRQFILTAPGRHQVQLFIKGWLDHTGWWGFLVFILIYTIGCAVFLPASLFTGLGCLLYGKYLSIPMNLAGAMAGAAVAFLGGRYLFHDTAQHVVGHRLDAWNDKLSRNGMWVVMWIRICFVPFPVVNLGAALTKISFKDFMLGTFFSTILPLAYISYTLGSLSELALQQGSMMDFLRSDFWLIVVGLVFYLSLPKLFKLFAKGRMEAS